MKKNLFLFLALISFISLTAQESLKEQPGTPQGCTSIMVGIDASADGSVMTSHTCDANYRTWLNFKKGDEFGDTCTREIYKGIMHTENAWDMDNVEIVGEIPQISNTFTYLNTSYPCMNEKQLAIGETTFGGKKELRNKEGMFLIEELEAVALERCATAREAISLIGELIEEYGYGDGGECITIADKKEVWQMEITGEGNEHIGGLWVAQRIPDDHIGVSANIPRIGLVDFDNPDYFMYANDLRKKAKKLDLWDGKSDFIFYDVIGNNKRQFSIREFYVFSKLAPSQTFDFEAKALPFSIKPEEKVDIETMFRLFRETYEDTEWFMSKNLLVEQRFKRGDSIVDTIVPSRLATGWLSSDQVKIFNALKEDVVQSYRPISVRFCAYSFVIQCRDWVPDEVGAVAWFSFDISAMSPRLPIFSGQTKLPRSFNFCGQPRYNEESALWSFRETNRLAMINWGKTKRYLIPEREEFEKKGFEDINYITDRAVALVEEGKIEEAEALLNSYSINFSEAAIKRWEELGKRLWHLYNFGL